MTSVNKLLGIIPAGLSGEVWATLEAHKGALYITLREQQKERWSPGRKPKPPLSIKASNFSHLKAAIDAAELELQQRGFLPKPQGATEARQRPQEGAGPKSAATGGASDVRP